MANRLKQEKSPYLLQHGDNPVDWYPWCREAFQKAAREDKPVFLSIGYSTCHWCHVMAHESFEDGAVAERLNRDFVSIKVDREERPDVDAVYMSVCLALTGSGGWPLTILMTPEQEPFFAGTYLPKTSAYGHLGLTELLEQAAFLWKNQRTRLLETGRQITKTIGENQPSGEKEPTRALLRRGYGQLRKRFDAQWGGFGEAPKFPAPHNLLFLLGYARAEAAPEALTMVETTLDAMDRGGIHDQLGGGFSRYSTDGKWLIPHFEKMLYDNALLLLAYLEAFTVTRRQRYGETARQTADYILRELTGPEGGFFCGQDADSDGVEGKFYAFTPEEIQAVLGEEDGREFCRLYGITAAGNFQGKSIPNRIGIREAAWSGEDPRRQKLYAYRRDRTRLHRDDKILFSWNAWTILALARAGRLLGAAYLEAAVRAQDFLRRHMVDANDRLYLRCREGEAAQAGQLEDYGVYALALLELYHATFRPRYLEEAIHRARQMTELFEDRENGGYFITAADGERLIVRPKETYDGAIPSGNSVAAMVLQKLAALTGEAFWREAARRQLRFLAGAVEDYPGGSCWGLLAMTGALYPQAELVCAAKDGAPQALEAYLREKPGLTVLLKTGETAQALARCAPFTAEYPLPEQGAVYYLCENGACKAPVTELEQLADRRDL